jgi:hypothetical protein
MQRDVEASGCSVKDRLNAYMSAVRETNNASSKSPQLGEGIKERMKAYQEAANKAGSPAEKPPTSTQIDSPMLVLETEAKSDSPCSTKSTPSIKERMSAYEEATVSKNSPKSPFTSGPSLKERLAAYQETASTSSIKKQGDVTPFGEGAIGDRISAYIEAASPSSPSKLQNDELEGDEEAVAASPPSELQFEEFGLDEDSAAADEDAVFIDEVPANDEVFVGDDN